MGVSYSTREEWLEAAIQLLHATFLSDHDMPTLKISVGWPKGARAGHVLGQCWGKEASQDSTTFHIFVSPMLEEVQSVLNTTLHELIHAVLGTGVGHKGKFVKLAKRVGFMQPWKATPSGPELVGKFTELARELGPYPHVGLYPPFKKQTTRMRLWVCECGVKIRRAGELHAQCLDCNTPFTREEE